MGTVLCGLECLEYYAEKMVDEIALLRAEIETGMVENDLPPRHRPTTAIDGADADATAPTCLEDRRALPKRVRGGR